MQLYEKVLQGRATMTELEKFQHETMTYQDLKLLKLQSKLNRALAVLSKLGE